MNFKTGDVVQLMSGGPLMTVKSVSPISGKSASAVYVVWFDKKGSVVEDSFSSAILVLAEKQ